jgi:hypothetical protein
MWNSTVAKDQQVKAEAYLLEQKQKCFKRSARAEEDRNQLHLEIETGHITDAT